MFWKKGSTRYEFVPTNDDISAPSSPISTGANEVFSWGTLAKSLGPAFMVSVGYMDPGNWATDIEGGSKFGYSLLWVLVISNFMAILLQTLAARLGLVTGHDLADMCYGEYVPWVRYLLWVLCEMAIAATDLAEVLGTAIGLKMVLKIPLLWGVVLTGLDTFLFLFLQNFGWSKLEAFVLFLLGVIAMCFIVELFLCKPSIGGVAAGLIPSLGTDSIYIATGMLGATVMPHNFYLHSAVVQTRSYDKSYNGIKAACLYNLIDTALALNAALFVNAAILIVSAASFWENNKVVLTLEQAHDMLEIIIDSKAAPIVFGVALICAGQSSTLTGTLAGQYCMEGFLRMKMRPWIRRLLTRLVAIVPSVTVILISGDMGTYQMLILSQVVLSLQLPFAMVPLIRFTGSKAKMGPFRSNKFVRIMSAVCVAVVTILNGILVIEIVHDMTTSGNLVLMLLAYCIVLPLSLFLITILAYISLKAEELENFPYVHVKASALNSPGAWGMDSRSDLEIEEDGEARGVDLIAKMDKDTSFHGI